MNKLTVDKVWANDKDFDGNPYINKFTGQPEIKYTFVSSGAKFYANGTQEQLSKVKDGDTIEGIIAEKVSKAGKEYKTFSFPKLSPDEDRLKGIEEQINLIWQAHGELEKLVSDKAVGGAQENQPIDGDDIDEIPF